jgi:hypothetical protein
MEGGHGYAYSLSTLHFIEILPTDDMMKRITLLLINWKQDYFAISEKGPGRYIGIIETVGIMLFHNFSSVKIWSGDMKGLNQCTDVKEVPFSLLAEVHIKQHVCLCLYFLCI